MRVQNIILRSLPVAIAGVTTRERSDCELAGRDADTFLELWEQARGALTATRLSEQTGSLDVQLVRIDGRVDAMKYHEPETAGMPAPEIDSLHAREWMSDGAFPAAAAETLLAKGYVRRRAGGGTVYDVPTAKTLLSDDFLPHHCFSVVGPPRGYPEWIGIGFVPRAPRASLVDLAGILWLDRSSAELRRLEFEYTNMAPEDHELCEGDPPQDPLRRRCEHFAEKGANRFGIGGDADFRRLGSGEWLIVRWAIRTLSGEFNSRPSPRKTRLGHPNEQCFSKPVPMFVAKPGDCVNVFWPVPRLSVVSTAIGRLMRAGGEIYRDDSSLALIGAVASKQAGKHPAHLDGVITDPGGRPLLNAIVQIENPGRVGITDSLGVFRIRTLPPEPVILSVRCRGYQPVRFRVPLLPDSTRRVSVALVVDSMAARASSDCANSK